MYDRRSHNSRMSLKELAIELSDSDEMEEA
jgi:hypothetical protein